MLVSGGVVYYVWVQEYYQVGFGMFVCIIVEQCFQYWDFVQFWYGVMVVVDVVFQQVIEYYDLVIVQQYVGIQCMFVGDDVGSIVGILCVDVVDFLIDVQFYCVIFGDLWVYLQFQVYVFVYDGLEWVVVVVVIVGYVVVIDEWYGLVDYDVGCFVVQCYQVWC